jgi:hypothetical protein
LLSYGFCFDFTGRPHESDEKHKGGQFMFLDLHTYNWFIRPGQTDMRKRSNSLSMLVHNEMNLSLFEKNIFVFCGGNKKVIRAIVWDRNGWWELCRLFRKQNKRVYLNHNSYSVFNSNYLQ